MILHWDKNLTLAERIDSGDFITIKYSFGDIIIKLRYAHDDRPSLRLERDNKSHWFENAYLCEYDRLLLMSGFEELAKEALQSYYETMSAHAEFFKP